MSTSRQIAAGQVRTLRSMRKKLLDMAARWDGVDMYLMSRLEEVADAVENLAVEMVDLDRESGL